MLKIEKLVAVLAILGIGFIGTASALDLGDPDISVKILAPDEFMPDSTYVIGIKYIVSEVSLFDEPAIHPEMLFDAVSAEIVANLSGRFDATNTTHTCTFNSDDGIAEERNETVVAIIKTGLSGSVDLQVTAKEYDYDDIVTATDSSSVPIKELNPNSVEYFKELAEQRKMLFEQYRKLSIYRGVAAMPMMASVVSTHMPPQPQNDVTLATTPDSQTGRSGDTLTYTMNLTNNGTVQDIIVIDPITSVPAGWRVELEDAGIPQALPYLTPLLASKTSHPLTLDAHIPANATDDATMTINIHSYANHSITDSVTFECLVRNNGDLNHDGAVTTADAAIALRLAASGEWNAGADVSGDGRITSLDALMILQLAAGLTNM